MSIWRAITLETKHGIGELGLDTNRNKFEYRELDDYIGFRAYEGYEEDLQNIIEQGKASRYAMIKCGDTVDAGFASYIYTINKGQSQKLNEEFVQDMLYHRRSRDVQLYLYENYDFKAITNFVNWRGLDTFPSEKALEKLNTDPLNEKWRKELMDDNIEWFNKGYLPVTIKSQKAKYIEKSTRNKIADDLRFERKHENYLSFLIKGDSRDQIGEILEKDSYAEKFAYFNWGIPVKSGRSGNAIPQVAEIRFGRMLFDSIAFAHQNKNFQLWGYDQIINDSWDPYQIPETRYYTKRNYNFK